MTEELEHQDKPEAPVTPATAVALPPLKGRVFLTGGAGFLGRVVIRRAQREEWPCRFLVFSRDEEKQWKLSNMFGSERVECYLGDVRDYQALQTLMVGCDIVIHAGAVKFIPEAERNVWETIKVNVDGTRNVIRAAAWCNVARTVLISTDKAVQPINVYGMTKALGERMFAEANRWREQKLFASVRYGNVVGSTGSIIPVFRDQLAKFGKVRVTDPAMTRFWMAPDEAVDAILLTLAQMHQYPGAVFVPRIGAMNILDLAKIVAAGAPIEEVGARPGEKVHETLVHAHESSRALVRDDHYVILPSTATPRTSKDTAPWEYSSYAPSEWIGPERMAAMIEEAKGV